MLRIRIWFESDRIESNRIKVQFEFELIRFEPDSIRKLNDSIRFEFAFDSNQFELHWFVRSLTHKGEMLVLASNWIRCRSIETNFLVKVIHVVKIKNRVTQLVLRETHWRRCKTQTQLEMQDATRDARHNLWRKTQLVTQDEIRDASYNFFLTIFLKKTKNKFCVINNKHTISFL